VINKSPPHGKLSPFQTFVFSKTIKAFIDFFFEMDLIKGYKIKFSLQACMYLVHYYSFNASYKAKKRREEKKKVH
jgi:hypothetical protein